MSKSLQFLSALILLCSCSGGGSSGTGGYSVKGRLVDNKGNAIKGASVTIVNQNQVLLGQTSSNDNGIYEFNDLDFELGTIFCDIPDSEFDEEILFDFPDGEFELEIITTEQDDGEFDSNLDYDDDLITIEEEFYEEDDIIDENEDDGFVDDDIEEDSGDDIGDDFIDEGDDDSL